MKLKVDWDERRFEIISNLTKNVAISQMSVIPYREIEKITNELINYLKEKKEKDKDSIDKNALLEYLVGELDSLSNSLKDYQPNERTTYRIYGSIDACEKILALLNEEE